MVVKQCQSFWRHSKYIGMPAAAQKLCVACDNSSSQSDCCCSFFHPDRSAAAAASSAGSFIIGQTSSSTRPLSCSAQLLLVRAVFSWDAHTTTACQSYSRTDRWKIRHFSGFFPRLQQAFKKLPWSSNKLNLNI